MLHLKLLGSLSLGSDSGQVPAAAQQKRRLALLALLAIAGDRGISRDRLQAFLWPESSAEKSRHALDQLIYAVRRALGVDPVLAEGRDLRLDRTFITSDLSDFAGAIAAGRWAEALTVYGGPLLEGFHISESRELESWVDSERMRLEQEYQSALETLAKSASASNDPATAVQWWKKLSASDPLSSRIALEVIQALADAGERPAAIQHARTYQQLVRAELEIEPDPRIAALAAHISRINSEHPAPVSGSSSPLHMTSGVETDSPASIGDLRDSSAPIQTRRRFSRWGLVAAVMILAVAFGTVIALQRAPASPVARAAKVSDEARDSYLRGLNAWSNRTKDGFDSAVVHFRRAIDMEPTYAEAFGGLANSYVLLGYSGYRPANAMFPKAKAAALRAIELDSTLAAPYAALGLELTWEKRFSEAEAAFRKSVSRDPQYATGHQWYGMLLRILGRVDEAVAETRRAAELDPLSTQVQNTYATFLSASGDEAGALRQYEKMIGQEPDSAWVRRNPWLLTNMAAVYAANGMMGEALEAAERSVAINPRHPRSLTALANIHIKLGDTTKAREIFSRVDMTNEHYTAERAFFYLELGMRDSAFYYFDRVQEWPIPIMIALGGNRSLKDDPRYAALMRKIGIPPPR